MIIIWCGYIKKNWFHKVKKLLYGAQANWFSGCGYKPGERSECPFCDRTFVNTDAFIDHLLLNRRNSGIIRTFVLTNEAATSKIVMHAANVELYVH